jgi:dipeptidyl aminopeptidase/acylaminoacyl peptidase
VGRDYATEVPVSDAEFEIFRRMYAYDRTPLNPVVERVDTFEHWVREKVVFEPSSGVGGGVVLYVPRDAAGPYQPIVYFGGTEILDYRSIEEEFLWPFDFFPPSGRVVAVPLYKGTYGRQSELPPGSDFPGGVGRPSNTYRDATITWVQDLGRVIDYLETRPDMDAEKAGYYGFSHGGYLGPIILAVEDRLKAGVLNVGGLVPNWYFLPEADPINFVTRVTTPTLMINGKYDIVLPYETSQLPMYELLGTPAEDKRHFVAESGHIVPKDDLIRETLAWFDKYLGPVGGG